MRKLATIAGVFGTALAANATIWDVNFLNGLMTGTEQVPANSSLAQGGELGTGFAYNDVSNRLDINFGYGIFGWTPLEGNYSGAAVRLGGVGETGAVQFNLGSMHLALGTKGGFFSGNVTLSESQEQVLFAGNYYISITSAKFPSGEIRGQLSVVPEPGTWALMGIGIGALVWLRRK